MQHPDSIENSPLTAQRHDDAALVTACRCQAGLSREQLGRRLGVPVHIVALWETPGYEGIDLRLLRRVAKASGRELALSFSQAPQTVQSIAPTRRSETKAPVQELAKEAASRAATSIAAALVLLGVGLLPGCITETESSLRRPAAGAMRTEGVIVDGQPDEIWAEVQATVAAMTSEPLMSRGVEKSFHTRVGGDELSVIVERYDAGKTIVHVVSTNPDIAARIRRQVTLR